MKTLKKVNNLLAIVLVQAIILCMSFASGLKAQTTHPNQSFNIGDIKITKIEDSQIYLPVSYLQGIDAKEANKMEGGKDTVLTPVNAYLIQLSGKNILIDAGMGKVPGENSGHLMEHLKAAGVEPSAIQEIFITHFHYDHIGGLLNSQGERAFPKATVRVSQVESDFWTQDTSQLPQSVRKRAAQIQSILKPYKMANLYKPISVTENLGEGIKAIPAYGHTIGHTVYSFTSKGKTVWCIGDLIHYGAIQFQKPNVSVVFDTDNKKAIASRTLFFDQAAKESAAIAASHLFDILLLQKQDDGYKTTPLQKK